ncbi:MAG: hypothetical protein AMXMBFR12_04570, partial [Candidatus Babeliales bacterium]
MRVMVQIKILFLFLIIPTRIFGYGLPKINLGGSSFLDGGPLRQIPGYYFQWVTQDYDTHEFEGPRDESLCGRACPHFNEWVNSFQIFYLSQTNVLGLGNFGWDITVPIVFYSKIEPNFLGITSSGGGVGDLAMGAYIQAHPIYHGDRPVYVHRLEFVASFPTSQDKRPLHNVSPGNGVFYMNPYWAATMYFTPRFSASWRLHYLWVFEHPKTHFKAGNTIHANFALEYALRSRFYLGINGYFLKQIKDNKLFGIDIPDSREQVLALGGGFLYALQRRFAAVIIANLYFETAVRNRAKGMKFVFRYYC